MPNSPVLFVLKVTNLEPGKERDTLPASILSTISSSKPLYWRRTALLNSKGRSLSWSTNTFTFSPIFPLTVKRWVCFILKLKSEGRFNAVFTWLRFSCRNPPLMVIFPVTCNPTLLPPKIFWKAALLMGIGISNPTPDRLDTWLSSNGPFDK